MNNEVEVKSAKVQELEAMAAKCWEPVKSRREAIKAQFEEIIKSAVGKSGVKGVAVKMRDAVDRAEVAADNAKCAEAEAQLAAGKFLKYGRNGSNQYYLIEKITPKCVFLKWERNDKAQVIREIVSGKCEVVSAEVAEAARAAGQYVRG